MDHVRRESCPVAYSAEHHNRLFTGHASNMAPSIDLDYPFESLHGLSCDDIRETAYEIFFTSCRSSPGFGGRNASGLQSSSSSHDDTRPQSPRSSGSPRKGVGMAPISRVKKALGLKMLRKSPSRKMLSGWNPGGSSSPTSPSWHGSLSGSGFSASGGISQTLPSSRARRPLTSAEIMRQQMKVTEQRDNTIRKTLMRTLVGQMGRRAETMVMPLELLRHIKPSEFDDYQEYHAWQKRQLKILEVGLLLHPSIPLEKTNSLATSLRDIIGVGETKPLETGKNSDIMRKLCNSVISLAWRSPQGIPMADVCHWADGYPLNIHIYLALLQTVFDSRDETLVLDEIDELFELMKKTWPTLGINKTIHNVCFSWILFHQYVATSEIDPDLLHAVHALLTDHVSKDAKKPERDAIYLRVLSAVLSSIRAWCEKRLRNYHDYFQRGTVGLIGKILPLALAASEILGENVVLHGLEDGDSGRLAYSSPEDSVREYIKSSIESTFKRITDDKNYKTVWHSKEEVSRSLLQLAKETEDLALRERQYFSLILRKWHPMAVGVAVVVLHNCYGGLLKQHLSTAATLDSETVTVLERAGKLENFLVQMVIDDYQEGGKAMIREMVPYEVDAVILKLLKQWIDDKLSRGNDCLERAKETETWNAKSKSEPYAQSVVEMMKIVKETVEEFFEIPIGITDDLIQDLADGLGRLFQDYISFAASCGSKQSYIPSLPPLMRCHRDSRFMKFFKKATPCHIGAESSQIGANGDNNPKPITSRGTKRLYIRLNSLHYLLSYLHSLNKTLSLSPRISPPRNHFTNPRHQRNSSSYFDTARTSINTACQHVSEIAAYRLVFLDSNSTFYDRLYLGDVASARISPAVKILQQNLSLLCTVLIDRAQALAVKEVMKVCFEAYLMVLLAGGNSRVFYRSDHKLILEDFESLQRVFCACGEGLIAEEVVSQEGESVEGVVELMGQPTEQLIEDFSILTCEASGIGLMGAGQKLPMPPTTRRWHRSDPNTILRILCHRNDRASKQFLKKSFQLAKRR